MSANQKVSLCIAQIVLFGILFLHCSAIQRVLYQSDFYNADDWTPVSIPGRSKDGWQLVSSEGVYRVCDVNSVSSQSSGSALNNILSKDFSKDNESTKLLLEADLQITPCKDLSKGGPIGCKEQVKVDVSYSVSDSPEGQKQSLVLKSDLNVINIEFPPGVTEYTIRLIDEGVCAKLLSFKVACFVCESQIDNLVQFKERVASGDMVTTEEICVDNAISEKAIKGFCFESGVWKKQDRTTCQCKPGFEPSPDLKSCLVCGVMMYKSETSNENCSACPANSATKSYSTGRVRCECEDNHNRRDENDASQPCLPMPNKPRNLKSTFATHSQIELSWKTPYSTFYRPTESDLQTDFLSYSVNCEAPSEHCFGLQHIRTNDTRITIENLVPSTEFTWKVCSENSVSKGVQEEINCAKVVVATLQRVTVQDVRLDSTEPHKLLLYWTEPDNIRDSSQVKGGNSYLVRCTSAAMLDGAGDRMVNGSKHCRNRMCTFPIPASMPPGEYYFKVGIGNPPVFSEPTLVTISSNLPVSEEIRRLMITVGLLFAVLLMILASCIAIFCCCRQKIDQTHPRFAKGALSPNFYAEQYTTIAPPTMHEYSFKTTSGGGGFGGASSFVEPCLHPDPESLLAKYTRELNEHQVLCNYYKLKGKFNEAVELGTFCEDNSEVKISVGLQHFVPLETTSCGGGSSGMGGGGGVETMSLNGCADLDQYNHQTRRELVVAAATCAQLIHPNVLSLNGFVKRDDESLTIVTEHAELGPLLCLLQQGHVNSVSTLIHMARGVACGMRYLEEEGYIHKVLKTANILVSQNLVCKISGFSQRAKIESQDPSSGLMIPEDVVPWTAPEVLLFQQFSWASDVWSFGVVLWEMLSQGGMPYYDQEIPTTQIVRVLEAGFRLPPPPQCPQLAFDLMSQCWCGEGNRRPHFSSVVEVLETLMRKPLDHCAAPQQIDNFDHASPYANNQWFGSSNYAMYNTSNKQPGLFMSSAFRGHNSLTSSNPNNAALYHQNPLALQPSPVSNFLAQLGLNQYENLLLMTGIQTLEDLQRLSNEDLKDIGIRSSKHRKRIVQSCVRLSITGVKQTVNLDYNSSYQSSSLNTKSWNGSQMSPENPREQLMSQYV